eukprot:3601029-Pleurochrysis_carterae.AAC.2
MGRRVNGEARFERWRRAYEGRGRQVVGVGEGCQRWGGSQGGRVVVSSRHGGPDHAEARELCEREKRETGEHVEEVVE